MTRLSRIHAGNPQISEEELRAIVAMDEAEDAIQRQQQEEEDDLWDLRFDALIRDLQADRVSL